ncbi:PE domain-containing protein [Amycolatopsis suaedae]|uniref:PE domain-containing protein n=1 Tax=Amycolatopsis suaedae TaxID=2510978 RepID=A0A4Q7JE96_9PSEU|nr:PE domain-containing protein [Amycolatopsis suaedae]RZQ65396.1 PE domain-containing protein [Amycolatopsis suaedae]
MSAPGVERPEGPVVRVPHNQHGPFVPGVNYQVDQDFKKLGAEQAKADFASAGSGWQFDPEAIDGLIRKLEDIRQGPLREGERRAPRLIGITPPGDEIASQNYVADANRSGASYARQLQANVEFLEAYVETLVAIKNAYQAQDEAALAALRGKAADA